MYSCEADTWSVAYSRENLATRVSTSGFSELELIPRPCGQGRCVCVGGATGCWEVMRMGGMISGASCSIGFFAFASRCWPFSSHASRGSSHVSRDVISGSLSTCDGGDVMDKLKSAMNGLALVTNIHLIRIILTSSSPHPHLVLTS